MKSLLFSFLLVFSTCFCSAQIKHQYFDGADTAAITSVIIDLDTSSSNIWQIGPPQKIIFDSAATLPNALVTDTINDYPINNISRFTFTIPGNWMGTWGILAIRWKQKIDFDTAGDGGIIEYTSDSGASWHNVIHDPYTYNFYGFDTTNIDTLSPGEYAFSGTDSNWRDIWLCFDKSFISNFGSLTFRYTLKSDNVNTNHEGWLIDNMSVATTWVHTVKKMADDEYMRVYPTKTTGILNIEAQKLQQYHIIKNMQLVDVQGRIVREYGLSPTKFRIDIGDLPDGMYRLKVTTNIKSETFTVLLNR